MFVSIVSWLFCADAANEIVWDRTLSYRANGFVVTRTNAGRSGKKKILSVPAYLHLSYLINIIIYYVHFNLRI